MVKSMYAAIAGLRAHQTKMDVISNNIANVNTWGYKSKSTNFQDAMYQNLTNSTSGNTQQGGYGGTNSSQLGYGVNVGSVTSNFSTGSWGYTGDPLNVMLNQTGFFIVGTMNDMIPSDQIATSNAYLSRVGIFSVDSNGYLVDDNRNYVYGFTVNTETTDDGDKLVADTTNIHPIQVPIDPSTQVPVNPDDPDSALTTGERYQIQSYSIGADGTITGITYNNERVTIGQIAMASVENPNGLEQTAGYLYKVADNSGNVTAIQADKMVSNYLEMSNVDLSTDMSSMITTQRGYQANSKIITVTDEMLETLVNMKR